jgi:SanA protein
MRKSYGRVFLILFSTFFVLAVVAIFITDAVIRRYARGKIFSDTASIPFNKVGLLLGTGKFMENGSLNPFYEYRIEAAAALMKSGKIKDLVISGDNSRKDYNEPEMMKQDLIKEGIDSNLIYLDYAGFRTFDSIVRLREIFSQTSVTVISQPFHNERAIFIAGKEDIHAIGYNARDVAGKPGIRIQLREKLARVKVFLDMLTHKKPRYLGPKVTIF